MRSRLFEKEFISVNVGEIAEQVEGRVVGDASVAITGVASVDAAEAGELVFAESARFLTAALQSHAAAVLTHPQLAPTEAVSKPLILVESPRAAFVRVLETFDTPLLAPPGVHATALIGQNVRLGEGVHIADNVTVGNDVTVGDRVVLLSGVRVGEGCVLGDDTILFPNVVLYARVTVGKRCRLHAGCVLGADGFGYISVGVSLRKVPQLGSVEIGDDVEIGANSCIDRAKTGVTRIGSGTKIDNLVHVAHNVQVGQSCLLVAQVGIAGSATLGNGVVLAGQAGVSTHVHIGDGARVGGQAAVIGDVPPGVTVSGYPARPHAEKMRELAASANLPDYVKRIRALEKRLEALERPSER